MLNRFGFMMVVSLSTAHGLCVVRTTQRARQDERILRTQRLRTFMVDPGSMYDTVGSVYDTVGSVDLTYPFETPFTHYPVNTPMMWGFMAMISTHVSRLKWGYVTSDEPYEYKSPFKRAQDAGTCPECNDLGEIPCIRCRGQGFTGTTEPVQCPLCDATGFVPCIEPLCVTNSDWNYQPDAKSRGRSYSGRTPFRSPVTANDDRSSSMRKPRRLPPSRDGSRDSDYMGRPTSSVDRFSKGSSDLPR